MRRAVRRWTEGGLLGLVVGISTLAACSTSNLAGPGEECFLSTDCEDGLVCVPAGTGSKRVCSADLSGVLGEGGAPDTGGNADAGGAQDVTFDRPPMDTGTVDTGDPDTGTEEDSGGGGEDAGEEEAGDP